METASDFTWNDLVLKTRSRNCEPVFLAQMLALRMTQCQLSPPSSSTFKSSSFKASKHPVHNTQPMWSGLHTLFIIVRLVCLLYVWYLIHTHLRALLSQLMDSHATATHALRCVGCKGRCVEPQEGVGVCYACLYIRHGEMFRRHAFPFTKRVKLQLSPTVYVLYCISTCQVALAHSFQSFMYLAHWSTFDLWTTSLTIEVLLTFELP